MGFLILWLLKEALSRLFRMLIPTDQIAVVGTGVLDKLSDLIRIMPCQPDDALDNTFVLPHGVVPIRVECQEQREHVRLVATKKPALNLRNDLSWQLHGCAHVAERKRSAMRRRGLRIETETRPAHSLKQKLGIVVTCSLQGFASGFFTPGQIIVLVDFRLKITNRSVTSVSLTARNLNLPSTGGKSAP
jgi:hypothetical protein